jgi:hypothetical protein
VSTRLTLPALFAAALWCALVVCAPPVLARPPRRVSLQYTRAENALACIDPVTLAHEVEAFTGPVLVAPSSAEAALEAHVEAKARMGFRVRIQLSRAGETPHGERILEVDSPDCRSFDDALAFVIATTIDPDLVLERVGALFDPTATPPKEALIEELARVAAPASRSDSQVGAPSTAKDKPPALVKDKRVESRQLLLGIGVTTSNELPVRALGPALLVRFSVLRWLELGAGARMMFGLSERPVQGAGSVSARQFSGALLLCPRAGWGAVFAASLCAGAELSLLSVVGHGFENSTSGVGTTLGFVLRPELALRISRAISLHLSAFLRAGARNQLAVVQPNVTGPFFVTPLATIGAELSVSRSF